MGRDDIIKLLPIPKLGDYLNQVDKMMRQTASGSTFSKEILQLIDSGGKRLRPVFLLASAKLCGHRIDKQIISSAAAIELVHKASLVHDDIIDKDGLLPPDQALLIGDYLIAAGLEHAAYTGDQAVKILAKAIQSMAEGQAMQLKPAYKADVADKFYIKTVKHKTAALFSAACQLGSLGDPLESGLSEFGESFGVAFQVVDDITDGDFKTAEIDAAKSGAQKFVLSAKNSLKLLPPNELKEDFANFPQTFLDTSLR